ncbi:MAG: hypothetical protein AAFO91_05385, partial [Bacteroidota bacterium]
DGEDALTLYNVEDKDAPVSLGSNASLTALNDISDMELYAEEGVLYITSNIDDQLTVVDISDPDAPVEVVTLRPVDNSAPAELDGPQSLERIGERLVVTAQESDSVLVFDISDPDRPVHIWTLTDTTELELDGPGKTALGEGLLLVAGIDDDGLQVFNIPVIDALLARIDTIYADDLSVIEADVDRLEVQEKLVVEGKTEAYDDITVSGADIEVVVGGTGALSHIASVIDDGSTLLAGAYDIVVQGTTAFVTAINEDAVSIWDVSDPENMVELSRVQDDGDLLLDGVEAVDVDGDLMVVGSSLDDAITLFDISDLTNPVVLGSLEDAVCNSQAVNLRPGNPGCPFVGITDVEIVGDYVYTTSDAENGVAVVDISDPTDPQFVDSLENTECDAVHGGLCALNNAADIEISGGYAFVAGQADNGIAVLNVSDPQNLYHATSVIDGGDRSLAGITSITLDGNYLYATAEDEPGFAVIDISDPEAPVYVTEIGNAQCDSETSGNCALLGASDSAVVDDYLYVSSSLDDGISVFDISDPTEPTYIDSLLDGAETVLDGVRSLATGAGFLFAATGISEDGFGAFSIPKISAPAGFFTYLETAIMNVF